LVNLCGSPRFQPREHRLSEIERPGLAPNKFNHGLASFYGIHHGRRRTQDLCNQNPVVRVADANPQNRRTVVARRTKKRKITILGNQNGVPHNSLIPNLPIGRRQQANVGNVYGLIPGSAPGFRQRGWKLCVDEKKQGLFRGDNRMISLARGESENRVDIGIFEIGIFPENILARLACRQQTQNVRNRNAQIANTGAAMHSRRIDRNSGQKIGH
jgi:hypothetical protein